jgi:acyl-CoA thioesterase-2
VPDLDEATRVTGGSGRYRGAIDPDWFIWGPNGGYLSGLALRAAVAESRFRRVASYSCVFLGVARAGAVDLRVEAARRARRARRAEAFRVELAQDQRPILSALLWLVDAGVPGLVHRDLARPEVPPPDALEDDDVRLGPSTAPLFQRLERRGVDPVADGGAPPRVRVWLRFRGGPPFDDPLLDALRPLIASDLFFWPALARAHGEERRAWTAPGLDLQVHFHDFDPPGEWLLCDTHAPLAHAGLLASTNAVWSQDGRLLVSSKTQALFRAVER